MWVWKHPSEFVQRIRPWAMRILIGVALISLGFFLKSPVTNLFIGRNVLQLNSMPFTARTWASSEQPDEIGWTYFSFINGIGDAEAYRLDYSLPLTTTKPSWVGIVFSFSEPQDLTDYEFVEINIDFENQEVRCSLDIRDISKQQSGVALGLTAQYAQDIEVRTMGTAQTIVIPLDSYYGSINRKVVLDMGFSVGAESSPGSHYFTINGVRFLKSTQSRQK